MIESLLIVGLNPALQRTILLPALNNGEVNRAKELIVGIGGKGQNVATAAKCLNIQPDIAQFIGSGYEGDNLIELLKETTKSNDYTIRTRGRCRCAITLVDASKESEATEIVEPSSQVSNEDIKNLLDKIKNGSPFDSIAFMGSAPPGCDSSIYSQILKVAAPKKIVIDTVFGIDGLLTSAIEMNSPPEVLLKVNARELCKLGQIEIASGSENFVETSIDAIKSAGQNLLNKYEAINHIVATDSKFPTTLIKKNSNVIWRLSTSPLHRPVISPIGAGDSVAAGVLVRWNEDDDDEIISSVKTGIAAGAASCMSADCSRFTYDDFQKVHDGIKIEEIPV